MTKLKSILEQYHLTSFLDKEGNLVISYNAGRYDENMEHSRKSFPNQGEEFHKVNHMANTLHQLKEHLPEIIHTLEMKAASHFDSNQSSTETFFYLFYHERKR